MAITRNDITLEPRKDKAVAQRTDPFDATRRRLKTAEAQTEFEKTGDLGAFKSRTETINRNVIGGSVEKFNAGATLQSAEKQDYENRVAVAQSKYTQAPSEQSAAALKETIASGKTLYGENTARGVQVQGNERAVSQTDMNRKLLDLEFDWKNDPLVYQDEYKAELEKQIKFYGADSLDGITLRSKLRNADEESLLSETRNAMNLYETDPEANIEKLNSAQKKLVDFYGSSADGYYALKSLNSINSTEQERLDSEASIDFESGKIGYDGYSAYLTSSMSKYPEGSEEYMKYYKASSDLKFNKSLDDLIRLQYSQPKGQVMKSMRSYQSNLAEGSTAFNQVQDQIDSLEQQLRYDAYQEVVKKEVANRQEQANDISIKLASLEQDYVDGAISKSKYTKKMKGYNSKLDFLTSSYTLPQFDLSNTYGVE